MLKQCNFKRYPLKIEINRVKRKVYSLQSVRVAVLTVWGQEPPDREREREREQRTKGRRQAMILHRSPAKKNNGEVIMRKGENGRDEVALPFRMAAFCLAELYRKRSKDPLCTFSTD